MNIRTLSPTTVLLEVANGSLATTKPPEQTIPTVKQLDGTDWETCMTLNDSWGYKRRGTVWKPRAH